MQDQGSQVLRSAGHLTGKRVGAGMRVQQHSYALTPLINAGCGGTHSISLEWPAHQSGTSPPSLTIPIVLVSRHSCDALHHLIAAASTLTDPETSFAQFRLANRAQLTGSKRSLACMGRRMMESKTKIYRRCETRCAPKACVLCVCVCVGECGHLHRLKVPAGTRV